MVDDAIEICHGSPFDEDAYIYDELEAVHALNASVRALCFFGHTHYPAVFQLSEGKFDDLRAAGEADTQVPLREAAKYLVNPGSVGQPRDGDPRAAYAIADIEARRVELFRIEYAVNDAQAKVLKAGLPRVLAQRLAVGR